VTRFACIGCGAVLTADLVEVPMPEFEVDDSGDEMLVPLMARGTYAADAAPFGPPSVPVTPELARLPEGGRTSRCGVRSMSREGRSERSS
jgi:hypothetical protein